MGSQREDHFLNLERRRDREVSVHTTHTNRSQSRSRSHISNEKDTKPCSLRLTVCEGGYDTNDGAKLLQILTFLLMMIRMVVTGPSKGLLPVSFSRVMRTIIMSAKIGAHLAKS